MSKSFWLRVKVIAGLSAVMSAVYVVNVFLHGELIQWGIIPRDTKTWYHVVTAPFIHGSYAHLFNNIVGLSIFSAICLLRPIRYFAVASVFIVMLSGALVWAFARPAVHIGASGWIFGLWSLSIVAAWFERSLKSLLIAFLVVFFYGGMIYGVLPTQPGVSFEAHLFGVLAGAVFAATAENIPRLSKSLRWPQRFTTTPP